MPNWIALLLLCLLSWPIHAAKASDPLEQVAILASEFDPSVKQRLQQLYTTNYTNASLGWRLRWHAIQCDQAASVDDLAALKQQQQQLNTFIPQHNSAALLAELCRANLANAERKPKQVVEILQQLVENELWVDNALHIIALTRLGIAYSDIEQHSKALQYLSQAIHLEQQQPTGEWLHANPALLHFALARTFSYTNNSSRADEAMKSALNLARSGSALEWFVRFNYAVMLAEFGQHPAALAQLRQLPSTKPNMGPNDRGYTEMYLARIKRFGEDPNEAKQHIANATEAFSKANNQSGLAQIYTIEGQLLLELGDNSGWQQLAQAKTINKNLGLTASVADVELWSAKFLAKQKQFESAYQALQRYTDIKKQLLSDKQEQALSQQQNELGEEMDRHRQRLASTAEAHYQDQQSLLLWRGYGVGLTTILFIAFIARQRHKKQRTKVVEIDNSPEALFANAIQLAKESGDAMPVVLVRINDTLVEEERLRLQVNNELRPQDSWLRLSEHDFVVLLPWASDAELHWRFNTLPEYLANVGVQQYQIGRARLHSFDDVKSLLVRLECSLTRHDLRQRPQATDVRTTAS